MRAEFSKAVRRAAFARAEGRCEQCGVELRTSVEYHHKLEAYLGGDNSLENCEVLCRPHHDLVTKGRRPEIDKTRRISDKRMGIQKRRSRLSHPTLRRRMDGTVVPK